MTNEAPFRFALLAVMLPTALVAVYHRIRARSGEVISHREEGYLFFTVLRLAGLLLWVSTLCYLLSPRYVAFASMPLPAWLRWSGAGVGPVSCGLMYWTLSSLGRNLTDTVVTRANAELVTHGPYRFVRHPFYVTAALLVVSATLLSANWLIAVSGAAVLGLLVVRTRKEEQMLIGRFGDAYRDYRRRTGAFWPRLGASHEAS